MLDGVAGVIDYSEEQPLDEYGRSVRSPLPYDNVDYIIKDDTTSLRNSYKFLRPTLEFTGFCDNNITKAYLGFCSDENFCSSSSFKITEY